VGKTVLTAGQFAWCPALNETPEGEGVQGRGVGAEG